jgi:hypothetical protein
LKDNPDTVYTKVGSDRDAQRAAALLKKGRTQLSKE